jgi:hypothetical protein
MERVRSPLVRLCEQVWSSEMQGTEEVETQATSKPIKKSPPKVPKKKRGPARPYRRLTAEVLHSRISKLEKRMTRAKNQVAETEGFLEKYRKETVYRKDEKNGADGEDHA